MNDDNPYVPPRESAELQQIPLELTFELTEPDVDQAIKRYIIDLPMMIVAGMFFLFGPVAVMAYLEEMHGYTSPVPISVVVPSIMSGAYAAWYLTSIPVRMLVRRKLRAEPSLRPGPKTIVLSRQSIYVLTDHESTYPLADLMIRGNDRSNLVLEVALLHILIIPWHAFSSQEHRKEFERALKKRMRRFAFRRFFTAR